MVRLAVSAIKSFNVDFVKYSELVQVLASQCLPDLISIPTYNVPVQFTVRNYRPEDFETLWSIDQSCFTPGIAYSRAELQDYIHRKTAFTLIAESAGSVGSPDPATLGFLVAESTRGIGHIITIDVRAEARRHRVGSVLLASAESRLTQAGCRGVRLETAVDNLSALSFYKRHGYAVLRVIRHYYSNGVDALLLDKNLLSTKSAS
jgi:[ribosomal protein S18]-alanine N-acetyltransferase